MNQASGVALPNANVNERAAKKTGAGDIVTWQVKDEDNTLAVYSAAGSLLSSTTHDGRQVNYVYSDASTAASIAPRAGLMISATDPFGRSLQFRYNAAGVMSQMIDPAGQVYSYTYDTTSPTCLGGQCSRVVSVQYPDLFQRQYLWNEAAFTSGKSQPDALTGINEVWPAAGGTPARTVRVGSYGYDANGRAISTQKAGGVDAYTLPYRDAYKVDVTDPLNATRRTNITTILGATYPISRSQPGGSGCAAATSAITYDANGNQASEDDFNGHRVCNAYDLSRNLLTAKIEGLAKTVTCTSVTAVNATLPVGSRKTSVQWHPDWRLATKQAEPGRLTTLVYNGQPDPFNGGAIASCAPPAAVLPDGQPIAVLCRQVEQATVDADGHLGFTATLQAGVPNREQKWTYNAYGQVLTHDGPRTDVADVTTFAYYADTTADHTRGDLQSVTNAKGQITQYTKYNRHGQLLQSTDPNGVATTHTYDLRQRPLSTSVAGQTTRYTYDPVGQLKKVTQPDASWIGYDYDAAHRLIALYDNQGNRISYTLDNAGNRIAENTKDPSGTLKRALSRSIDALGRVQQTTGRE